MRAISCLVAIGIAAGAGAGPLPPDPRLAEVSVGPVAGAPEIRVTVVMRGSGRELFRGILELTLGEKYLRVPVTLEAGPAESAAVTLTRTLTLAQAKPWTPARPVLYQMQAALLRGGMVVDRRTLRFGLRTIALADGRLTLNGTGVPVRGLEFQPGWSLTLSARARAAVAARDLQAVREMGFTLILAEPGILDEPALDACDRLGLLVAEGHRPVHSGDAVNPVEADQVEQATLEMIRAHRHHPCVVAWRIPPRGDSTGDGPRRQRMLAAARQVDPDRPTIGVSPWPTFGELTRTIGTGEWRALNLEKEFSTATAFDASREIVGWQRQRHRIEALRLDPAAPGFILSRAAPQLKPAVGNHALVIRPGPVLLVGDAPLCVTLLVAGQEPVPPDAILEYRLGAPGDDPALPMPWRIGPPPVEGRAVLALAALPVHGRWLLSAQVRRGGHVLAVAEEAIYAVPALEGSQHSFALLGEAPGLRDAFGAWIIPPEFAAQTVVVHPATVGASDLAALMTAVRAGKKAIVLDLDESDLAPLVAAEPITCRFAPPATLDTEAIHYVRSTRFGHGLPGLGRGHPEGWMAGELYADLLPERSLLGTPGEIHAGALRRTRDPAGSEAEPGTPEYAADIVEVAVGKGRIIFCQYRVLEHLSEPLARALFYRLLAI